MNPPRFFFLYPIFLLSLHLLGITVLSQPPSHYEYCMNDAGNYTSNSTYKANLDTLLTSLTSNNQIDYGFYNLSAGRGPDQVNAIALCRGDVLPDACRRCVNGSTVQLTNFCPNQKQALGWYNECMLRYTDGSVFGTAPDRPAFCMCNRYNSSDVEEFNRLLGNLMTSLRSKAASGDWRYKFATGQASLSSFETLYGLMQCTPNLSELSCSSCLDGATNDIPTCCASRRGGIFVKASCVMRYETYPFYESTAANAPPPLAPPLSATTPSASNITSTKERRSNTSRTVVFIVVPVAAVTLMIIMITFIGCFLRRRVERPKAKVETQDEDVSRIIESLQFDFATIRTATDNFSDANKLGEGGFGSVYKGELSNGQEIAVKRLSSGSRQGELEFKNEVMLVAKLQHRNLVRLLGFCLEGTERLLVYEFVPKTSLDKFIFDPIKRTQLDWNKRYKIIEGVARGILYLHEDSRLRIIHRDLKASNILLDDKMNPKISDFGMARLFIVDQTQDNTSRIVGTFGYMAPEYAMLGHFSVKTDVYSFGVLVLEIVSGQKNNCSQNGENVKHLLSFAWKNWREGQATNLMDPTIGMGSTSEIMRCIHIGLLCVQENEADRPTMASIVLMLNSYSPSLPIPSQPAFFINSAAYGSLPLEPNDSTSQSTTRSDHSQSTARSDHSQSKSANCSVNDVSISDMFPR